MTQASRKFVLGGCFAATTLLSAFLIFQVQPLLARIILPWFGGSPAVWTTCMLFFQVALFGGYLYAHCLVRFATPRWQGAIHLVLLFSALSLLPILPSDAWKPAAQSDPTWRILGLLAVCVGLPYLTLSATGPLMQAWLSRTGELADDRTIYRLFALSNAGSLAALVTYPFVVEPLLATRAQGMWWSFGFSLFGLACGLCALVVRRLASIGNSIPHGEVEAMPPRPREYATWLALAALPSLMLLAITHHVCQDVAVMPFLWIVPLALYLLSFILCFERRGWYSRRLCGLSLAVSVVAIAGTLLVSKPCPIWLEVGINFTALFLIAMVCHGELAARRPAPAFLTTFYLMIAAGGALGGVFVGLIAPLLFTGHLEFKLGLVLAYLLAVTVAAKELHGTALRGAWLRGRPRWSFVCGLVAFAGFLALLRSQESLALGKTVAAARNFYGVLRVDEVNPQDEERHGFVLRHGRILHGLQFSSPEKRRQATTYFHSNSGIGILLGGDARTDRRVGTIGLGIGTIAAYGRTGDCFRFYEINPDVARLARSHFSYLDDSPATIEVVLGDARLSLEHEPPQKYDVLVLDAFTGDAIPIHLLTREALAIYLRHLQADGILALHITNRHVDLNPVIAGLAREFGLHTMRIRSDLDDSKGNTAAVWVLVSRQSTALQRGDLLAAADPPSDLPQSLPLWRDDYSNLLEVMR